MTLSFEDFEKAIKELYKASAHPSPYLAVVHPSIWNGYWYIHERSKLLRWIGRKLHSRLIYSWGLRIEWITGMKDWPEWLVKGE